MLISDKSCLVVGLDGRLAAVEEWAAFDDGLVEAHGLNKLVFWERLQLFNGLLEEVLDFV